MTRFGFKLILLIAFPCFSFGQNLNFKHISFNEGLAQSPISCFLQDRDGFVWFGNLKGLIRYDGYELKKFSADISDKTTISNSRVNAILQDSNGQIWVGTANGLNRYNRKLETFTHIDILDIKGRRNYISSVVEDKQKNIWVGTFGGLKKLNLKTLKLEDVQSTTAAPNFKYDVVYSLYVDKENKIWVGTNSGLRLFDPTTAKAIPLPSFFYQNDNFVYNKVFVTKQDPQGNLWFGTETSGVFKTSVNQKKVTNYAFKLNKNSIAGNWVKDILIDGNEKLWFATRNGISVLDAKSEVFTNYKHDPLNSNSLSDNTVWSFLKDKDDCIWVGTFAGGINFYYKGNSNFQNIGESIGNSIGLNHVLVNAITEDENGGLWVGTFGGGLNFIDRDKRLSEYYAIRPKGPASPSVGVKSLADDGKGNLWVGSLNGLGLFNKATKTYTPYNFKSVDGRMMENLIICVLPDKDGVWVGTDGGGLMYVLNNGERPLQMLKKVDKNVKSDVNRLAFDERNDVKGPFPTYSADADEGLVEGLTDNFLTCLLKDGDDFLWIGTQNGLNYYDIKNKKVLKTYQKIADTKYQISNGNISTMFKDSKNRLWVGTEEGGLNYFDRSTDRFYSITKKEGLKDEVIHAIVEDKSGNLWLSTDLGINKLNFNNFSVPFNKNDLVITGYTASDGLASNQFSSRAGLRLRSNEIAFGGLNGISIFFPDRIIKNTEPSKVVITQFLVNNKTPKIGGEDSPLLKSITETEEIALAYDQSSFSIKYAALNFINPDDNSYAYKLDGLPRADEWQNVGKQRVVNFANLPPGNYIFKVKAANKDRIWSNQVQSLIITVLPPWWATWWAYLIYIICISSIAVVIVRFLRNRAMLKRDLYLEHVHNERREELYQMKLNFFTNISHEIRTPLTLILGPLDKILRNPNTKDFAQPLNLIKNNADRLMKLVTELLDFRKAEEGHMRIYCSQQDIVVFCKEIFDSFAITATDSTINYKLIAPQEPVLLYFDENQMEKVLLNLLSNAFKFTSVGGEITMEIKNVVGNKRFVDINITDNGKGIPKDMHSKLFQSFFQVDDRGRYNIGSGIGLVLSKSIVELHRGSITFDSDNGRDNLTTFTISLPTGKDHLTEEEIVIERDSTYDNSDNEAPSEDQTDAASVNTSGKKYTVLVAEDNDDVRKLITDILIEKYKILQFSNAEDSLVHMENEIPDLIVSDIMMPGINGLEFCKKVKLLEYSSHIPFILLTAKASIDHQIDGLSIGADAYISKPFSPQILELNIKNLLHSQEVMREKFGRQFVVQPSPSNAVSPEEKFLQKLMTIIEFKIEDSTFDVNDLVAEIGMSRTVLYKKVQSVTGYAVADLIKQIRLKKAAELFKQNSYSVAEVAYMVGFNDRKHFSKEFKKYFELSPTEFIQKHSVEN